MFENLVIAINNQKNANISIKDKSPIILIQQLKETILDFLKKNEDTIIYKLNGENYITTLKIMTDIKLCTYFKLKQDDINVVQKNILEETGISINISNDSEYIIIDIINL